jgi:hypothetical protein
MRQRLLRGLALHSLHPGSRLLNTVLQVFKVLHGVKVTFCPALRKN